MRYKLFEGKNSAFIHFVLDSYPNLKFFILFGVTFASSFWIVHNYKENLKIQIFVGGGTLKKRKKILKVFFSFILILILNFEILIFF